MSVLAENVATPFDNAPVPNCTAGVVVLSRKVTIPVGVPIAGATADTVATKLTGCPARDGFAEEASTTAALPLLMTSLRAADVALVKLVSPE
jgi:hypothetical protein